MAKGEKDKYSNLDRKLQELTNKPKKKSFNLYLDVELYDEAREIFGKRISAICEAALRDAVERSRKERPS